MRESLCILLVLGFLDAWTSHAATRTRTANGYWNAGSTWVGEVLPAAGDDIVLVPGLTATITNGPASNILSLPNTSSNEVTPAVNSGVTFTVTSRNLLGRSTDCAKATRGTGVWSRGPALVGGGA